jgi:hypothetical protein
LYDFTGVPSGQRSGDGSGPISVTFDSQGNLWGAAANGGYCQPTPDGSCFGALFELKPPTKPDGLWSESIVYRFSLRDENPILAVTVDSSGAVYELTYVEAYRLFNGTISVISDHPGLRHSEHLRREDWCWTARAMSTARWAQAGNTVTERCTN